jgi:hypothetical protein
MFVSWLLTLVLWIWWGVSSSFTVSSLITTETIHIMKFFGLYFKIRKIVWQWCILHVCNSKQHFVQLHYLDGFANFGFSLQCETHIKCVVVMGDINVLHLNSVTFMPTVDYLNVLHLWCMFSWLEAYLYIICAFTCSGLWWHTYWLSATVYHWIEHNMREDLNHQNTSY